MWLRRKRRLKPRHRLGDGDSVPLDGFLVRHGWHEYPTQALPLVHDQAPLLTPGQRHRAGAWRDCDG
jgi:hypothetical protein